MALEATLVPRGPYSLEATARRASDATRLYRDGMLTLVYEIEGRPARASVWQRRDGSLAAHIESDEERPALEHLRFVLAIDDDHGAFLRRFARDELVGDAIRRFPGLRPIRTATVAHALVKAVCGQLIQARAARLLENRLLRRTCPDHAGLRLPPTSRSFASYAPAELVGHGLAARKAAVLVRLAHEVELERLRAAPTCDVVERIVRERGLGPWSAGVVCLHGLGRYEHGLVGDLGLIKLCAALHGRFADAADTDELLEPYGEWAGLASVYLLASLPVTLARRARVESRGATSARAPARGARAIASRR